MTDEEHTKDQSFRDKLISTLLSLPWLDVLSEVWKFVQKLIRNHVPAGPYEVLEYESTLELLDAEGKHAIFRKREKIRYLQDNIIAYQDQAWGDGEILVNYRCTPGKPVDCYRTGHKWHMLISRREVRNKGDIDVFNIEWEIRNGFLKPTGYWETHITHPTEHFMSCVVFPKSRHARYVKVTESNRRHSYECSVGAEALLPDGRQLVKWETQDPSLHENFILQWEW